MPATGPRRYERSRKARKQDAAPSRQPPATRHPPLASPRLLPLPSPPSSLVLHPFPLVCARWQVWGPREPYRGIDFRERDTLAALLDACIAITKSLTPAAAILAQMLRAFRPLAYTAQATNRYVDITVVESLVAESVQRMLDVIRSTSHERSRALATGCVKDMGCALDAWQAKAEAMGGDAAVAVRAALQVTRDAELREEGVLHITLQTVAQVAFLYYAPLERRQMADAIFHTSLGDALERTMYESNRVVLATSPDEARREMERAVRSARITFSEYSEVEAVRTTASN